MHRPTTWLRDNQTQCVVCPIPTSEFSCEVPQCTSVESHPAHLCAIHPSIRHPWMRPSSSCHLPVPIWRETPLRVCFCSFSPFVLLFGVCHNCSIATDRFARRHRQAKQEACGAGWERWKDRTKRQEMHRCRGWRSCT